MNQIWKYLCHRISMVHLIKPPQPPMNQNCPLSSLFDCLMIGTYFTAIMFMVASSCVTTILILNYHHRWLYTLNIITSTIFIGWRTPTRCQSGLPLCFSNGCPGSSRCHGPERRSQGRQSWWPRRWSSWTSRRPPPSLCSPTSSTWTMTSDAPPCPAPLPTPVMSHPLKHNQEYWGKQICIQRNCPQIVSNVSCSTLFVECRHQNGSKVSRRNTLV